jgi:excisionase family DNA binding protein
MASKGVSFNALQLLTPAEAAKLLAISDRQLRELSAHGDIPFVNIGLGLKRETRRYRPDDIKAFIEARTKTAFPQPVSVTRQRGIARAYPDIQEILRLRTEAKAIDRQERRGNK